MELKKNSSLFTFSNFIAGIALGIAVWILLIKFTTGTIHPEFTSELFDNYPVTVFIISEYILISIFVLKINEIQEHKQEGKLVSVIILSF